MGYTKSIDVYTGGSELELFVRPDADLDGEFVGVDRTDGTRVRVAGWLADEIVERTERAFAARFISHDAAVEYGVLNGWTLQGTEPMERGVWARFTG